MTINRRIIAELAGNPTGLTHQDLATRLNVPEPSIRRSVQQLRKDGTVVFTRYADSSATDMLFALKSALPVAVVGEDPATIGGVQ